MAMNIGPEDFRRWASYLEGEFKLVRDGLRDKGAKYFARPLGGCALVLFVSYQYVFMLPKNQLVVVERDLDAARATARYAGDYEDLRSRLNGLYARLPRTTDPETWLLSEVRESLRLEGIVPNSFSSPSSEIGAGYKIVSLTVSLSAGYRQLASWVARLERGRSLMHVRDFTLVKRGRPIGMNNVTVTVVTIVPLGGSL